MAVFIKPCQQGFLNLSLSLQRNIYKPILFLVVYAGVPERSNGTDSRELSPRKPKGFRGIEKQSFSLLRKKPRKETLKESVGLVPA